MWARLEPHHGYTLEFQIEFDNPAVAATGQQVHFDMGSGLYKGDRPCTHLWHDLGHRTDALTRLTLGGSMDNAIVVWTTTACSTADGLRYDDEFVEAQDPRRHRRHAGRRPPAAGGLHLFICGHALNNKLRALLADSGSL